MRMCDKNLDFRLFGEVSFLSTGFTFACQTTNYLFDQDLALFYQNFQVELENEISSQTEVKLLLIR